MLKAVSPKHIGWEPYVNFVWLVFLIFQPLFTFPWSLTSWLLVLGIIACFIPFYLWASIQTGTTLVLALGFMVAMAFALTPLNAGASGLFIYATTLAAACLPSRRAFAWLVVSLVLGVGAAFLSPIPYPFNLYNLMPPLIMNIVVGGFAIFHSEKERSEVKLQMANEEIEHLATIAERERIARDLHDLLGHTLSVIALKSELANKLLERNPAKAKQEMLEVERISRESLSEVRAAVTGYRAKGLTAEIAHAKLALESAGVSFAYQNTLAQLGSLQESTLCLVIREAVTNIIRHAKATRCAISLTEDENELRLEIADNGKGIKNVEGSGLSGMRERVQALGGVFNLENSSGVRLRVSLPKVENQSISSSTRNEGKLTLIANEQAERLSD